MDEHVQAAGSPAPSPAKPTRGGFRGRGGWRGGPGRKAVGRKPAMTKRGGNRGRGRGRYKTYDHPRVQAAYERSKELRDFYFDVANAMKPALEKLADHTLNQMIDSPDAHTKVPEYFTVQTELDDRLDDSIQRLESEETAKYDHINKSYRDDNDFSQKRFMDGFEYVTDEFLDGILNRITLLEELRREEYPTDLPASYTFVQEPDEVAKDQGPYVMIRNGVEVPYPHLLADIKTSAVRSTLGRKKPGPKRKAEDVPDGQPESKRLISGPTSSASRLGVPRDDTGGEASTPRPRHIGGLLSAETEPDGEPESNAPSPTPLEEGMSPQSSQQSDTATKKEKDLPDLPAGASEPDQWGTRTVSKRGPKANNRLIIPCLYDFDEDDIGFRDSTNDSTRKASKNTRGRFLNKPNSRFWHLDQTILNYNCLDYRDGDLDPKLVKKHNLHPRFGFFLPDSINEQEAPKEDIDTTRPVVLVTPNGSTLHASRTVRARLMDNAVREDRGRNRIGAMVQVLRQDLDLDMEDITTEEMRRKQREEQERQVSSEPEPEPEDEEDTLLDDRYQEPVFAIDPRTELMRQRGTAQLLDAAQSVEDEERAQEAAMNPRASRPYDAVRDIFGASEPPPPMPVRHVDTYGLSVLADVSENPQAYCGPAEGVIMNGPPMMNAYMMNGPHHGPPSSSTGFLQTALNPTQPFAPIAPAPPQSLDGRPPTPVQRNPFTGQVSGKGSPALPPLRPGRRDKISGLLLDTQAPQPSAPAALAAPSAQTQPIAPMGQEYEPPRAMMQPSAGAFYPSGVHHPFHNSFSPQEPAPLMSMAQPGPPGPVPPIVPSQAPPQHLSSFSAMSPPVPGHAQLAPMPHQMGPSPPTLSQGPFDQVPPGPPGGPLIANSPPTTHQRGPSLGGAGPLPSPIPGLGPGPGPGGPNGQNAGKYRRIAAAPIPYNRQWPSNGGTELRLSSYDPKGAIKDYSANEPPPRTGPTTIRGWSVNNGQRNRNRAGSRKEGSVEDTESPK
ncbi:hypothetical protein JX266_000625 [Neoarthrinium moseri]|nr:hypothetical protein JX266_000625 [Neoarthrinium moseri]